MPLPSEALAIGRHLEIGVGEDYIVWLASRLEDHAGDNVLTVAWPTDHERRLIGVPRAGTLEVALATRDDAMYTATVVVRSATRGAVPLLTLEVSGDWRRSQRRDAVRTSVAIRPRVAAVLIDKDARRPLRLGLTNISASGVQVRST